MNKKKMVLYGLIICIFALGISITLFLKTNDDCMRNPFIYGAKEISKQDLNVRCICNFDKPNYNGFWFDKEEMEVEKSIIKYRTPDKINWSNVNVVK